MASCRLAAAEVRLCLLDGGALLGTHLEILGALDLVVAAVAHLEPGVAHVVSAAAKPFAAHVLDPIALQALCTSWSVKDVPSSRIADSAKTISYGLPSPG
mgnify:CR=1 FL=1